MCRFFKETSVLHGGKRIASRHVEADCDLGGEDADHLIKSCTEKTLLIRARGGPYAVVRFLSNPAKIFSTSRDFPLLFFDYGVQI